MENNYESKPKSNSNVIKNLLFFLFLIGLTVFMLFKDENPKKIWDLIMASDKSFLLWGVAFMVIYEVIEAFNLKLTLKALGHPLSLLKNIKFTLIGAFFSGITPAASGGQPMEIYYMHKDGVPVAKATLSLLLNLIGYQTATLTYGIVSFFIHLDVMQESPALILFFCIGIGINIIAFTLLLIGLLSKRLTKGLINIAVKGMKLVKFKKTDKVVAKLEDVFGSYQESSDYVKKNPRLIVRVIVLFLIQFFFYYSVSYWTYRALGLSAASLYTILTLQAVVFATVSGIPLPGSVGVSEGAFIAIFGSIYTEDMLTSATLMTRIVNFYFVITVAAVVVIVNDIRIRKNKYK